MVRRMIRLGSVLPPGGSDAAVHRGARRRSERFPIDADIELLEPVPGTGVAINASTGGMRLALDVAVPLHHECTFRVLRAPSGESVEQARVVWRKAQPDGYLLGVAFIGPGLP